MATENVHQEVYFNSYEDLEIHYLMLQDSPRNEAYRSAIFNNKDYIRGKTVLDVGTGTGLLSIFCAQAGASKIYAVEASNLFELARKVVTENGFDDIVEVIHSKIEDFKLPNGEKVDVIVSEWMGFYLLHEGMLDSVIFARDNFLKEGGLIFPETATIYGAPCSVRSAYKFWDDINGVAMKCVGEQYRSLKSQKPEVLSITPEELLHEGEAIFWLDLRDISVDELQTIYHQSIIASSKNASYQGVCLWFTSQFPSSNNSPPVYLSTAPSDLPTHWKQTIVVLPTEISVEKGSPIAYELYLKKSVEDGRRYNIELTMLDPEEVTHPEPCDCFLTKCIIIKKMLEKYQEESNAKDE